MASNSQYNLNHADGLNQIGYATLVASIFFMTLSTLAVILRLWTKRIIRNKLGIDDLLVIASLILFYCSCGNILVGVYTIGGGQVYTDPFEAEMKEIQYLQSEYAIPPIYAINVTTIKVSILFFYRRIFTISSFKKTTDFVLVICLIWFIAGEAGDLLYCIPMRHFWDPTTAGSCFNFADYFLVMELVDLLLDVCIICLPIKPLLGLQISSRKKLALLGIFLLGAFVIVTGAIRIAYVYQPDDEICKASLWSVVHLGTAILCACLPALRPLLPKAGSLGSSFMGRYMRSRRSDASTASLQPGGGRTDTHVSAEAHYHRITGSTGSTADVSPIPKILDLGGFGQRKQEIPLRSIVVQRGFDVV